MSRSLPDHPSLRHLKIEAKRRLADGEFRTLHDAQTAIAREHDEPSWAALKRAIEQREYRDSHALTQLRWLVGRFTEAGQPGWSPPGDAEMSEHFTSFFLSAVPVAKLVGDMTQMGAALGGPQRVLLAEPLEARIELAGLDIITAVEAAPPHRITGLRATPVTRPVSDARTAAPPPVTVNGDVADEVRAIALDACTELGLAGLALAGGDPDGSPGWVITAGWRDLDRGEVLDPAHRFPAAGLCALVTATAVLRLVADGAFGLDDPANGYLRTVRLADDTITVRELLSHTAGVDSPADLFGPSVPDLVTLTGPVLGCHGPRGMLLPSNGGHAALGQLVADVTGEPFTAAATRMVLEPLGMTRSWYPLRAADLGDDAVTGYDVGADGRFTPVPAAVCTLPAIGGLWAPPADLLVLGTEWASLLPPHLAGEAVTRQPFTRGYTELEPGLGWLFRSGGVALHGGSAPGYTAVLDMRVKDGRVHVLLASRQVSVEPVEERMLRAWTEAC